MECISLTSLTSTHSTLKIAFSVGLCGDQMCVIPESVPLWRLSSDRCLLRDEGLCCLQLHLQLSDCQLQLHVPRRDFHHLLLQLAPGTGGVWSRSVKAVKPRNVGRRRKGASTRTTSTSTSSTRTSTSTSILVQVLLVQVFVLLQY